MQEAGCAARRDPEYMFATRVPVTVEVKKPEPKAAAKDAPKEAEPAPAKK